MIEPGQKQISLEGRLSFYKYEVYIMGILFRFTGTQVYCKKDKNDQDELNSFLVQTCPAF